MSEHNMSVNRVGFFGAIMATCSCGWTSKQIKGTRQTQKATKAYRKHLVKVKT